MPILYKGNQPVFIPDSCVDTRLRSGEVSRIPLWTPRDPLSDLPPPPSPPPHLPLPDPTPLIEVVEDIDMGLGEGTPLFLPESGEKDSSLINVNTCTKEDLMGLEGIGGSRALSVIDARPHKDLSFFSSKAIWAAHLSRLEI